MLALRTRPTTHMPDFEHRPVLLDEVVALFEPLGLGIVIDATLGGGGHASALLDADADRQVIGIDRDPAALDAAHARLAHHSDRFSTRRGRFDAVLTDLDAARRAAEDHAPILGVLFDLGVSSPQLDHAERGFSYRADAPLDMRMDPDSPVRAWDLVNETDVAELARILRRYGDERFADRIARAVVAQRPVDTTRALAEIVREAIPAATRRRGGHPAKRTFQAIRIAVNDELDALARALEVALDLVDDGGRIAAISYHSGEDRIVKATFRRAVTGGCTCPPGLPCGCGAVSRARNLTRGGITPGAEEASENPRSTSARLRAVEVRT